MKKILIGCKKKFDPSDFFHTGRLQLVCVVGQFSRRKDWEFFMRKSQKILLFHEWYFFFGLEVINLELYIILVLRIVKYSFTVKEKYHQAYI